MLPHLPQENWCEFIEFIFSWSCFTRPSQTPTVQLPSRRKMASISFSPTFPTGCFQTRTSPSFAASCPSMPFWIKSSLGSSKSTLFQHGFSLQSSDSNGGLFKSRPLGVYARAATEKTLYDFTVKVYYEFIWARKAKEPKIVTQLTQIDTCEVNKFLWC